MASQGPNSPSTASGSVSPNNIKVSDGVYDFWEYSFSGTNANPLIASNFGFTIPTGATINGIQVDVQKKANYKLNQAYVRDDTIYLYIWDGSSWIMTASKADTVTKWDTTEAYASYGGPTDLWGVTWTAGMLTSINGIYFLVYFRGYVENSSKTTVRVSVDHIRVTIYYTTAASGGDIKSISCVVSASISKIGGVSKASISKVGGETV